MAIADCTHLPTCLLAGMMVSIGNPSHLNKSAVVATDCIMQAYGNFIILHKSITVPAANGDKLCHLRRELCSGGRHAGSDEGCRLQHHRRHRPLRGREGNKAVGTVGRYGDASGEAEL